MAASENQDVNSLLGEVLTSIKSLQRDNVDLAQAVDAINGRVNMLAGVKQLQERNAESKPEDGANGSIASQVPSNAKPAGAPVIDSVIETPSSPPKPTQKRSGASSKIILTSYPGQAGVDPLPMNWGDNAPDKRGPVVVSRHANTFGRRNGA